MVPMTFDQVQMEDLDRYIDDDAYVFEQKLDGTRVMMHVTRDEVTAFNRRGAPLKQSAAVQHLEDIAHDLKHLADRRDLRVWIDGELMTDTGRFYAFDLPLAVPLKVPGLPSAFPEVGVATFGARRRELEDRFARASSIFLITKMRKVELVTQARTPQQKRDLVHLVTTMNGEGVVVKHLGGRYTPGERSKRDFKAKIVRTVDVFVTAVDRPDRRHGSFSFAVYGENGLAQPLGSCSAIGKPHVEVGDVIEVQYLAWMPGGGLREPRMMRVREDKLPSECTMGQLVGYSKGVVQW